MPPLPPSQILVLGMHHAGTSIVANLTMMLGANGGTLEGMLLHPSNPLKYWERADVVGLDEERLAAGVDAAAARYTLPDWVAYGFDADKPATKVHSTAEAKGVVAKLNAQRPWVTKDPRMSLVASEWVELLDAPACVIVHREPLSIANSMMIYSHNVSYAEWAAVYEAYYGGVARACAIVPTAVVHHEELMARPYAALTRLHADLSALGVERLTMPTEERINALLRPSPKTSVTYLASERKVLGAAAPALSDSILRGEVVSRPASPWLFIPLRKSQAYATLLTTDNSDYFRGAMVLGSSIRSFDSARDMVCLVTSSVPEEWRSALTVAGWTVAVVDEVAEFWFGKSEECSRFDKDQGERWGHMATKLRLWQQLKYKRILYLDADTVLTGDASDAFDKVKGFAAERARFHSYFNAGVMMLSPSEATYQDLLAEGSKEHKNKFGNVIDCTEQALLNSYYDGSTPERGVTKLAIGRADVANDWQAAGAGAPFAVHWITHSCPKPWVVADGEEAVPSDCDAVMYAYWKRVWDRLTSATEESSKGSIGSRRPKVRRMLRRLAGVSAGHSTAQALHCEYDCPQPPPPPPCQPGVTCVGGPCSLTDGGSCAASPNYPNSYGRNEECTISGVPPVELETVAFDVEQCGSCGCDYLTVNGTKYCGTSGPNGAVCWATRPPSPPPAPPSPPSPPSPPPQPPPPPTPPSPPPPPPLPPLSPGFDVAAATENELRSLIEDATSAAANVSIYLPPGDVEIIESVVRDCSAGADGGVVYSANSGAVSITSSDVSGCSATDDGGVVFASRSGAVSIIESNVTDCSAGYVGFQPKFKIVVSFYQVVATLGPVYGVRLHEDFTRWTDFIDAISFDLLGLTYPDACIGSMADRLLLAGLWPFAAMLLGGAAIACYALAEWLLSGRAGSLRRDLVRSTLRRLLYWAILVAYLVLPSVSRSIFKAKQCESYDINVFTGDTRSYLVADLDVLCSTDEHRGLDAYFWAFFVLWPVLVPLAFLALLLSIRSEVRAQRVRATARASRFLWRDYDPRFLFWEVVDLGRKLSLASLVLFIQTDTGSSKILRLFVASVVSALYLAVLALARPFKRSADLYLACTANLFLACCFTSGTVIQLCESAAYEDMCKTLVGFESARGASEFVIALTAAMLAASLLVVLFKIISAVRAPTIRLCSSGRPPVLELSPECHFHGFISHAWGTGQDQTHTVVRRLQLLLPGVRIWLDVDNLEDVGKLEESVADANTFLVFLSAGYFKSFNCRRELYAALGKDRPFIPIFEADVAKGGASIEALKAECRENCVEVAPPAYPSYGGPDEMIARVFEEAKPIVWVRVNIFQLVSLKAVALRMLLHSPYYASRPAELEAGVMVPGEAGPVAFSGPVTILVCRGNEDAFGIAEELKNAAVEGRGSTASAEAVEIRDAEEALEGANAAPCEGFPVFLLYLNDKTFLDAGGAVARLVQAAMDQGITIAMVHEQEPSCGGVPFGRFFQQTPQVLQRPPYKLFDTVAVALYPAPEHREVSSTLALVYGVRLDEHFTRWLDVLKLFSLDLFGVQHSQPRRAPGTQRQCIANMRPPKAWVMVGEAVGSPVAKADARREAVLYVHEFALRGARLSWLAEGEEACIASMLGTPIDPLVIQDAGSVNEALLDIAVNHSATTTARLHACHRRSSAQSPPLAVARGTGEADARRGGGERAETGGGGAADEAETEVLPSSLEALPSSLLQLILCFCGSTRAAVGRSCPPSVVSYDERTGLLRKTSRLGNPLVMLGESVRPSVRRGGLLEIHEPRPVFFVFQAPGASTFLAFVLNGALMGSPFPLPARRTVVAWRFFVRFDAVDGTAAAVVELRIGKAIVRWSPERPLVLVSGEVGAAATDPSRWRLRDFGVGFDPGTDCQTRDIFASLPHLIS
ncbi:hypothetical protein EMIHUDRAFT_97003 [Emiliania huxleyi CCMP1516]|uniref:TIR domain-containing protein n=2 Tax=Emiliania huxleyi TaxID=2903 RepID=A0A0D3I7D4_EMIH1|nr:hypothetical protein EMIHUDRAFT_97003 [Emiliania huxleyi CCMP1516]EOD07169.1 hypothetical protein EMIHUDRAFT_97003 [Emiliania huxleyi CCMP1516]|eukprot:XP_005759598.1 hypothetical protein EMIHUDRAFT_97003 [Emiliania huxleyi CCMP1516]